MVPFLLNSTSSLSEFGAELGLIHGERRLRLVQLFDKTGQLNRQH